MKIYTKTGDKGKTSLLGGTRVSKSHIRIETYGTVDETNSYIGLLRDLPGNKQREALFLQIQDCLFIIGSNLAAEPGKKSYSIPELNNADVESLEQEIDKMNEALPEMKNFILPGGHQSVSFCHLARVVCRRAERLCVALNEQEPVSPLIIQYLNRLSDFLFVLSRMMGQELGVKEAPWVARKSQ